jgi:hypothetical protein
MGLVLWGLDEMQTNVSNKGKISVDFDKVGGALTKVKDFFKHFLP